ncbi:MAG TPA: hypothetical protein PLA88_02090 [Bacteroidales bacterium]|nr:hypothetical protein [Bacteroidales bacterium]
MKRIIKISVLIFVLSSTLLSCNRFEEGSVSLRSVKKRLSRTWVLESYYVDGVDKTATWNTQYPNYKIEYRENFTYEAFIGNDSTYSYGIYNLQDWARKIERQPNNSPGTYNVHDILKLSTDELWTILGTEEFHFVAEEE